MFVHRPTHQAVEVLCQSLITLRDEDLAALETLMDGRSAFDHLSLDATGVNTKSNALLCLVEYPVAFFPLAHRVNSVLPHIGHFRLMIWTRWLTRSFRFRYFLGLFGSFSTLARANIYPLPLVIEMSAVIDVGEVGMEELFLPPASSPSPADRSPQPMRQPGHFQPPSRGPVAGSGLAQWV